MSDSVKILIVEDDPLIAAHLETIIERGRRHGVGVAADAETALVLAERTLPAVAIVDVRLKGGIDGLTVGRELLERYGTSLVFVTAHLDQAVRHFPERGVFFVGKPFTDNDILLAVEQAVGDHQFAGTRPL
ncbi:MAG TPA: response regulator [Alphaproteobacteria bacterium]|nr:response regulator [Alphaproteobacteria bacterium]